MSRERKKVLLVTEFFNPPFDEGIKKTAYQLHRTLSERYVMRVICRKGIPGNKEVRVVQTNKLFLTRTAMRPIREFDPDTIIYLPFASATFAGYLRAAVLKFTHSKARHIMIALQPKRLKKWQKAFIPFVRPECILTPSPQLKDELQHMQINHRLMPLLTDINKFKPLQDPLRKRMLRTKYGIPHNHYVISHMGHINEGRNLESLIPMQSGERYVLVIESSSTPKDAAGPVRLREKLEAAGIRIMNKYLDNIEEIYQLSDLYVFPVTEKTGSIGLPLSILEARACGIPVLTTEFGGIRNMLGDDYGNIFYSQAEKFEEALQKIREHSGPEYGKTKVRELNSTFIKVITEQIEHSH